MKKFELVYSENMELLTMAKTKTGKKVVPAKSYTRKFKGSTQKVKRHKRSTND